jgi:3',5'-nucleoside bisphosphate phosphatase
VIELHPTDGVDLHLHTTASDGYWTPDQLARAVSEKDINLIAVTDHDAIDSVQPTSEAAARYGVKVLPAVEFTVSYGAAYFHLLAYRIDLTNPALNALLADVQRREHERTLAALDWIRRHGQLASHGQLKLTDEEVAQFHTRAPLMHAKLINFVREYVRRVGLEDVPAVYRPPVMQAMQVVGTFTATPLDRVATLMREQQALLVVAHPEWWMMEYVQIAPMLTRPLLTEVIGTGWIDGLEVYSSKHDSAQIASLAELARQHNLLVSCGSDSHKTVDPPSQRFGAQLCRPLLERCGVRFSPPGSPHPS